MSTDKAQRRALFDAMIKTLVNIYSVGGIEAVHNVCGGISEEDLQRFARLSLQEIANLLHYSPILPFRINTTREHMDLLWQLAERRTQEAVDQETLIRHGACLPLLATEYGMTGEEYAQLRRRCGISSTGRPPHLTEQQEHTLRQVWQAHADQPTPQRWLAVARAGIPLASAWALIQKEHADSLEAQRLTDFTRESY